MKSLVSAAAAAVMCMTAVGAAAAQEVRITPDLDFFEAQVNGRTIIIERIQDPEHRLDNEFTKTSRPCPPFCIHPMKAADGVETVGEVEVMAFIEDKVAAGTGLLVDARLPEWFNKGAIPGSVNIPFTVLEPSNEFLDDILIALGGKRREDGTVDLTDAMELTLYCNGPWCDQSPRAIKNLVAAGYPAEKLFYYRGGIQNWLILGLNADQTQ